MANLIVTIDGPAASGKSTVARGLAEKLNAGFLDTGAMYRAATLAAMNARLDLTEEDKLAELVDKTRFDFEIQEDRMLVRINGIDVTEQIRSPEVTGSARFIASAPALRERLVRMQRDFAAIHERIVTEGRDQGTVAFPNAHVKFYLIAEAAERARRRLAELRSDESVESLEQMQKAIEERDRTDEARTAGPLRPAADAIVVDTTNLTIQEVLDKLLDCVRTKCSGKY